MKKTWLPFILSFALIFSMSITTVFAAGAVKTDMKVLLDGDNLSEAQSAHIVNNRIFLPYRAFAEKLGGTVAYDPAVKSVTVTNGSNVYVLTIGSKIAVVNGVQVTLDVPAQLIGNSTYVPVRFLAENMGVKVGYDHAARTVSLNTNATSAFKVFGVQQGDVLYTDQVQVSVAAFHHELADFRSNTQAAEGQGHIHLWLDTDPANPKLAYKLINGEPVIFDNVAPGDHTLTIQLVGNDHKPVTPVVKQTITFKTAAAPSLSIEGPKEGDIIAGDKVTVKVNVSNHDVVDFRTNAAPKAGQGHVHLWLDTDVTNPKIAYKLINGEPVVFDNVAPGHHTLTVQLVGNDHKPISPAVKQVVHFNTKAAAVKNYNVSIKEFAFSPAALTVEAGSTVTFTNNDGVEHTVTAKDKSFDSGLIKKGETATITFSKAGEYAIYCKPHTFMTAKIIVK
jgi:plastocyanin